MALSMEATIAQRTRTVRMISQEMIKDYLIHKLEFCLTEPLSSPLDTHIHTKADCKQ